MTKKQISEQLNDITYTKNEERKIVHYNIGKAPEADKRVIREYLKRNGYKDVSDLLADENVF